VQKDWLARAGASRTALAGLMGELGYAPYGLGTARRGLRHRLALAPLAAHEVEQAPFDDFAWLHAASPAARALLQDRR
jgi:hypothetical protein